MHESWQQVDGAWVRTRRAEGEAEQAGLRHEATLLGLARHPAVVEVVSSDEVGARLVTRVRAARTLDGSWPPVAASAPATPVRPRAPGALDIPVAPACSVVGSRAGVLDRLATLAAATQTVADLHALGLVHGDLRLGAIWVDDRGQAVLDGFARAGLAGHVATDGTTLRPSTDVAALARLVLDTLAMAGDAPVRGAPAGAPRRAVGRRRGPGRAGRPGAELAAVLAAGEAGAWPPARRLARALDAEVARSRARGSTSPSDGTSARTTTAAAEQASGSDTSAIAAGSKTGQAVGVAAAPADADPFAHLRPVDPPTRSRRRPPVVALVSAVVGLAALGWGGLSLVGHPVRPSLGRAVTAAAPVVSVAGTTYRIGRPGDEVRVGDWRCSQARAVLLRPDTGDVFVFAGWARPGHDLVGHRAGRVTPGSRLEASRTPAGCDSLRATAPDGATVALDPWVGR